MTRQPNDEQLHAWFTTLRKINVPTVPKGPTWLDVLERRLYDLKKRASSPGPAADGYPGATMGDGGSRGTSLLTSVEAAADKAFPQQRADGTWTTPRPEADPIAECYENAWGYIQQAVQSIGAATTHLDNADRLSTIATRATMGGAGACLACHTDVSGAAHDRLRSGYCAACYRAWDRAGRPERAVWERERRAYLAQPVEA